MTATSDRGTRDGAAASDTGSADPGTGGRDGPPARTFGGRLPTWTWGLLRGVVAAMVAVPGIKKFVTYEQSVAFFTALGMPDPQVLVLVVGAVEVAAAVLLYAERAVVPTAGTVAVVMGVAVATAGPSVQNLLVLAGSLAIVALVAYDASPAGTEPGK